MSYTREFRYQDTFMQGEILINGSPWGMFTHGCFEHSDDIVLTSKGLKLLNTDDGDKYGVLYNIKMYEVNKTNVKTKDFQIKKIEIVATAEFNNACIRFRKVRFPNVGLKELMYEQPGCENALFHFDSYRLEETSYE